MTQKFGYGYDWRGVSLMPGQTVIYGAGVGRSIAMVEAEVVELTMSKGYIPEPKVKLRVIYRAYGGSEKEFVTVGQDRVTVVEKLPPAGLSTTAGDEVAAKKKREEERRARLATHFLKKEPKEPRERDYCDGRNHKLNVICPRPHYSSDFRMDRDNYNAMWKTWYDNPCENCNLSHYEASKQPCAGRASVI